jgi:hypothetical protein
MKKSIYVCVIIFLITISCNNSSVISYGSDENYISISNNKLGDLEYLIGIKVRQLSEDKKLDDEFETKQNEIEIKYNNEIKQYIESEGFSESDFYSDTAFINGEPMDEYHLKKQKVSTKKNELELQKNEEISKLRFSILSGLIAKDKTLKSLVEEYKVITKKRSDILLKFGVQQSDSTDFFRKKLKSDLKDELWDQLIKN